MVSAQLAEVRTVIAAEANRAPAAKDPMNNDNIHNPDNTDAANDAGVWLLRRQVAELAGLNVDTVRRWQRNLGLTVKRHPTTGEVMFSAAELCAHGLIDPARATLPEQSIPRSRAERVAEARRQLATTRSAQRTAIRQSRLLEFDARHQHLERRLTLWLLLLAGLRIGEADGLRVPSGAIDEDGSGFLLVDAQGGRTFKKSTKECDGIVKLTMKPTSKTSDGYRLIAIPVALVELLLRVVPAFDTHDSGLVTFDVENDTAGRRYVTRPSVKAEPARRHPWARDVVPVVEFMQVTGLNRHGVNALVKHGKLVRAGRDGLAVDSVAAWAAHVRR